MYKYAIIFILLLVSNVKSAPLPKYEPSDSHFYNTKWTFSFDNGINVRNTIGFIEFYADGTYYSKFDLENPDNGHSVGTWYIHKNNNLVFHDLSYDNRGCKYQVIWEVTFSKYNRGEFSGTYPIGNIKKGQTYFRQYQ